MIVVGSQSDGSVGADAGAVYVFRRSGAAWTEEARLTPADLAASDFLGGAVQVDGDTILAGAPNTQSDTKVGTAYVFRHDGSSWQEEAKLNPTVADVDGRFGSGGIDLEGDVALISAPFEDHSGENAAVRSTSSVVFQALGT